MFRKKRLITEEKTKMANSGVKLSLFLSFAVQHNMPSSLEDRIFEESTFSFPVIRVSTCPEILEIAPNDDPKAL